MAPTASLAPGEQEKEQEGQAGVKTSSNDSQEDGDEVEEFYDAPQERSESVDSAARRDAQDESPTVLPFGQPLRIQTTPGKLQRRGSSLFGGLKRTTTTGAHASDNPRDPFQHTFDPLSSDSDSTSSSEDEGTLQKAQIREEVPKHRQPQKAHTLAKDQNVKEEERKGHSYSRFAVGNDFFKTKGKVSKRDGRLKISINETANSGYVAKALGQSIRNHLNVPKRDKSGRRRQSAAQHPELDLEDHTDSIASDAHKGIPRPSLNIVIMVIGSRGDIQPFLQIGKILKHDYGHRVRIASHPTFRDFVENDAGLEFFSVGGDPSELMAFMVKNPGLIPSMQTVREGEIQRRRSAMATMFEGFWRACVHTTDNEKDKANLKLMGEKSPFIADAIIANPPSMAHVHIAEKLGVPLHIMFTFPYTPTTQFPHPLANIKRTNNVDAAYVNFMSYPLVEMMTWQGLGDIVNRFRENTLDLEPVSSLWAPGALYRMKVPYTYLWSPSLVPKPNDWGPEVDLAGFVFLDLAANFKPPQDLVDFLDAGEPPVYVGFGSIVVDDPDKFTELIFKAADLAGVRVLVNKGWGGLGKDNSNTPKNVFMLENTPHDWLFPRVKAVVHHGGAGTTAIGLKLGKPTMIIPFFGDQPFWGARVAEAKAGANQCIRYKKLTAERLAEGIKQCLTEEAQQNAKKIADAMANEGDGAENAVRTFHRSLPLTGKSSMRCSILQDHVAVWRLRKSSLRLCSIAAEILVKQGKLQWNQLKLLRHYEWNDFDGPGGPFTGGAGALSSSLYEVGAGFGMVPTRIAKHLREREELERKKRERRRRREERQRRKTEQSASGPLNGAASSADREDQQGRPTAVRQDTTATTSTLSGQEAEPLPRQLLDDFSSGVKRSGAALLTMPNDFSLAIAQGFHNAPRLYGDATVRQPVRIKGVKSGCRAAREEFAHGISDAWTGLVMQPKGDWEEGDSMAGKFAGLGTGIGKAFGGFVLKNVSAVVSPPAFVGQGVIKSVEAWSRGPGSKAYIRRAHQIQGQNGVRALELQDPDGEKGLVKEVEDRVMSGWGVYEELWAAAREVNSGPIGKIRRRKGRKHWYDNGALENVDTAERALKAVRDGEDVNKVFARQKREMREAKQSQESAANDAGQEQDDRWQVRDCKNTREAERHDEIKAASPRENGSESTAVETPNDDTPFKDPAAAEAGDHGFGILGQAPARTVSV